MKKDKYKLIFIFLFFLLVLFPVFTINLQNGKISENENRVLASFPDILTESGEVNPALYEQFENWFGDNLGFRNQFLDISANIKVKGFHQSTSNKVHIGENGWYYYVLDDNLKIADGTYPLTEEQLNEIAQKQQAISDYYASQGKEYVLALTPSKASIYPEYIGNISNIEKTSPCDIVEEYLKTYTSVKVVNLKNANILAKDLQPDHLQFLKTDTHWTEEGAYNAYKMLFEFLKENGLTEGEPVQVTLSEKNIEGEFSRMLGSPGLLGLERTSNLIWNQTSIEMQEGEYFEKIDSILKLNPETKNYQTVILQNQSKEGTVLICGDSQWSTARNIPQLLSENFHLVVNTRLRSLNIEVDAAVDPDLVIFACAERYLNTILLRDLTVPELVSDIPDLPEKNIQTADYWIGTNGLCLDTCNDMDVESDIIEVRPEDKLIELYGWSADFNSLQPLDSLYLQVGDHIIQCEYGIKRTSVSDHYQNSDLTNTGFSATFPISYLKNGEVEEISFIQISSDGQYRYEPIPFKVTFTD